MKHFNYDIKYIVVGMNSLRISDLFSNGAIYQKCLNVQEGHMLALYS